jgi:hypothetical protein
MGERPPEKEFWLATVLFVIAHLFSLWTQD